MSLPVPLPDDPVARGLADRRRAGRALADGDRVHQEGDRRRPAPGAPGGAERAAADRRPGRGSGGAAATGRRGPDRPGPAAGVETGPRRRPADPDPPRPPSRIRNGRAPKAPSRPPRPPTPAPLLRTRDTANDVEAAKKVQEVLRRAEQNLAKVNYRGLSANGRQQADTARRFITQAGDALEKRQLDLRALPGRQGRSPFDGPGQPLSQSAANAPSCVRPRTQAQDVVSLALTYVCHRRIIPPAYSCIGDALDDPASRVSTPPVFGGRQTCELHVGTGFFR